MHVSPYPVSSQLHQFMDVSSAPGCDERLDMLRTTSRLDPKLNKAMVDGRRFSSFRRVRSGDTPHVDANYTLGLEGSAANESSDRSREVKLPIPKRHIAEEERELRGETAEPESPSSRQVQHWSRDNSTKDNNDYIRGSFCMQTIQNFEKNPRSPHEYNSLAEKRICSEETALRNQVSNASNADGGIEYSGTNITPVTYQSDFRKGSEETNILSKMYASFGHDSSNVKNQHSPVRKLTAKPIVKTEPNFEGYDTPPKRRRQHPGANFTKASDSQGFRKRAASSPRNSRLSDCPRTPPRLMPDNSTKHRNISIPTNDLPVSRKRHFGREDGERISSFKKRKHSSELMGKSRLLETEGSSGFCRSSFQGFADRHTLSERRRDDSIPNRRVNPLQTEREYSHIVDPTPESLLRLQNYSLAPDQMNLMSPVGCNGIGLRHDPALLLKSASLGAGSSINPFLLGMNPCLMNPFLISSLEQSEIMAAAAYRQVIAAQMLQSRIAGVKPLLGLGMMENPGSLYSGMPNFMCGFPDSTNFANTVGTAFRYNGSNLARNAHPYDASNEDIIRKTRKRLHQRDSTKSCRIQVASSSSVENEDGISHETSPFTENRVLDSNDASSHGLSPPAHKDPINNEFENYETTRSSHHRTSSPRTDEQSMDFTKQKSAISDATAKARMTVSSQSSTAISITSTDDIPDEKTSEADGQGSFSRASTYKNLTRERRLVANARERTRVHTISSAFEELRRQIPSYSCNQKLSKLAILRIACSYIQSLSVLAGRSTEGTFKESVDQCTGVLQAESKARCRRKSTKAQVEWEMESYEKSTNIAGSNAHKRTSGSSSRPHASPHTSDYWKSDRFVDGNGSIETSSNESDPSSPSHNGSLCAVVPFAHKDSNEQNERKQDESSSVVDETAEMSLEEFSPINVDD